MSVHTGQLLLLWEMPLAKARTSESSFPVFFDSFLSSQAGQLKEKELHHAVNNPEYSTVLVSVRTELIFLLVAGRVLCFGLG